MQLTEEQKLEVRNKFTSMQSVDELVSLINYINDLLYPPSLRSKKTPFAKRTILFHANHKLSRNLNYSEFLIKKKSGGERKILAPNKALKLIQRTLNFMLSTLYEPNNYVTGFVGNKSIVDNAKIHVGKKYVLNIDLKDFFPSIELHRIKAVLKLPPFNLHDENREKLAFMIANLCCYEGRLPQGAPTSPILSNIVCQKLDRRLNGLAKKVGAEFSRYADDITFSADADVFNLNFKTEMLRIIADQNFTINEAKVRLQGLGYKQEVTGLTVNEKVNVSKKYIREIRAMLHNWEKLGYEEAEKIFLSFYIPQKGHVKKGMPNFSLVLWGKLQFLAMVRGKDDILVKRYFEQYNLLSKKIEKIEDNRLERLEKILSIWENEGLDLAINQYFNNG